MTGSEFGIGSCNQNQALSSESVIRLRFHFQNQAPTSGPGSSSESVFPHRSLIVGSPGALWIVPACWRTLRANVAASPRDTAPIA
jgi:hypothetical protein